MKQTHADRWSIHRNWTTDDGMDAWLLTTNTRKANSWSVSQQQYKHGRPWEARCKLLKRRKGNKKVQAGMEHMHGRSCPMVYDRQARIQHGETEAWIERWWFTWTLPGLGSSCAEVPPRRSTPWGLATVAHYCSRWPDDVRQTKNVCAPSARNTRYRFYRVWHLG
jgi:hypothetical protein